MTVRMPHQCFINGQFEDAENGKTSDTINPADGSVRGPPCSEATHEPPHTHTHTRTHARIDVQLSPGLCIASPLVCLMFYVCLCKTFMYASPTLSICPKQISLVRETIKYLLSYLLTPQNPHTPPTHLLYVGRPVI